MPAELPNRYLPAEAQARWYPFWEQQGYFHNEPDERTPYTIVIPPPNVTGALHLGHALNNTLQDTLIRWKRMQGFNTLWLPGTDHAGIATQAVVERRLLEEEKKSRHDLGREALVARIWAWKNEYEARILGQLKQMGCSCDWQRTRFTLDPMCARAVRHTFFKMFRDHKIYRGKRLVNWDTFLQTAVSDDEVFHETVAGHFWHFRYPVIDPLQGEPKFVTIATTRPETMLGDTAVAVHPNPGAALDRVENELRAKLEQASAKDREDVQRQLDDLAQRRSRLLPELVQLREMARQGRKPRLPLVDREIPLVADEWAKPELGSGCVKITPAHDPNDYEVGKRQNLPLLNILNPDGTLNENAGSYRGLKLSKARERVVADLDALGLLGEVEDREIEIAHSDRSKTPIEPYLADQWFVRMDEFAQWAIDAVRDDRVQIFPQRYEKGYFDWLGEKRDWPVSRQLWWGHQIPIWYAPTASESDLKKAFAGRDDVAWQRDEEHGQWLVCSQEIDLTADAIPGHALTQDTDVLDTWFSSALWPHSTLGWPDATADLAYYYPTSALSTSREIITLWVARMVIAGLYNMGEVPFHEVYIHPTILDRDGERMAKQKGNGVDPLDVIEKFGADSLRFGLAYTTTETQDVRVPVEFECPHCQTLVEQTKKNRMLPRITCKSCGQDFSTQWAKKPDDVALPRGTVVSERFELARNFCNKLWNAARFVLMNLEGYTAAPLADDQLKLEDHWILSRLATTTETVDAALATYKFGEAAHALYGFAWDEFCSFYVEMVKNRLQQPDARPTAQRMLAHVLDSLVRLLHPLTPFVTEEVWQLLNEAAPERGATPARGAESVMIAPWPQVDQRRKAPAIENQFARFQGVLAGLREIRSRQNIPPKTTLDFAVRCDVETRQMLEPMRPYFESMAGGVLTDIGPQATMPALGASFSGQGMEVLVDLAGHLDLAAEIERISKELIKLDGLIAAKERKLLEPNFAGRAPAAVVQKERESLEELRQRSATFRATQTQLETLLAGKKPG